MNTAHPSTYGRLAYLDWLRFIVVLSLAPFHASISFTGMGSVYVYDIPIREILLAGGTPFLMGPPALAYFTIIMDNWFMHLLFLRSGIGAAFPLLKRSRIQFLGERCSRLLHPLLHGILLVISVQSWLRALSFDWYSGRFFAFPFVLQLSIQRQFRLGTSLDLGEVRTTGQELLQHSATRRRSAVKTCRSRKKYAPGPYKRVIGI